MSLGLSLHLEIAASCNKDISVATLSKQELLVL